MCVTAKAYLNHAFTAQTCLATAKPAKGMAPSPSARVAMLK